MQNLMEVEDPQAEPEILQWQQPNDDLLQFWEFRVLLVAAFWSIPGLMLGCFFGLLLTMFNSVCNCTILMVCGGLLGMLGGGMLEADHWI